MAVLPRMVNGEHSWCKLFFRVACNMMMKKNQNKKHYGTIRTLLLNCLKLLDKSRHPQVR